MRARTALATGAVLLALLAGCSSDGDDDDTGSADTEATDTEATDTGASDDLTSYDDITALHAELVANGVTCGLEYEGLRDAGKEVSICVIDGEQALLTIWDDPALVADFVESEAAAEDHGAAGVNWTVDVDSPEVAQTVADALGGMTTGG